MELNACCIDIRSYGLTPEDSFLLAEAMPFDLSRMCRPQLDPLGRESVKFPQEQTLLEGCPRLYVSGNEQYVVR